MFRREIDGTPYRFEVAGLWGSGNTVTERSLAWTGENTVYTMWTGEGLWGPNAGGTLEKYPALWGTLSLDAFLDRYQDLDGVDCQVFTGREEVGIDCPAACGNFTNVCGAGGGGAAECMARCEQRPRRYSDCLLSMDECSPRCEDARIIPPQTPP